MNYLSVSTRIIWHFATRPTIMALIQTDAIKEKLKANTQAAADRGVFGIPTFFVGDEMFFGKERLGQVEEQLVALGQT